MTKWILRAVSALVTTLSVTGCATVIQSTDQQLILSSTPAALVWIDGEEAGATPLTTDLTRKKDHLVRVALDGYQPYEMHLTRKVSGWVASNLILGIKGLPAGLLVDALSGAMYRLDPEVGPAGAEADARIERRRKQLFVTVTLRPDSTSPDTGQPRPAAAPALRAPRDAPLLSLATGSGIRRLSLQLFDGRTVKAEAVRVTQDSTYYRRRAAAPETSLPNREVEYVLAMRGPGARTLAAAGLVAGGAALLVAASGASENVYVTIGSSALGLLGMGVAVLMGDSAATRYFIKDVAGAR